MLDEAKAKVIRSIDNRIRELNLLDLTQIGYYNVNLSIFGFSTVGRIAILSDNDPFMKVELFDSDGKMITTINTLRKNVIRSIIDFEFSPEELKIYDGYLSYSMLQSMDSFEKSMSAISGLYGKKKSIKKELYDVNWRIDELMPMIDFDYCLIGSKCLYSALNRTKESIRKEYIKEGIEAASYNSSIERLQRKFLGKHIHGRKISGLEKAKKENTEKRLTAVATKSEELQNAIEKYMEDFKKRCMNVLKNYKVLRVARLSYIRAIKGEKSQGAADIGEITAEMIYSHFAESLLTDEILLADELYERFKRYILGFLYSKREMLEESLSKIDGLVRTEFEKQESITTDFVPFYGFAESDEDTYNMVYSERRK